MNALNNILKGRNSNLVQHPNYDTLDQQSDISSIRRPPAHHRKNAKSTSGFYHHKRTDSYDGVNLIFKDTSNKEPKYQNFNTNALKFDNFDISIDDGVQRELMNLESTLAAKYGIKRNTISPEKKMINDGALQFHPQHKKLFDTIHEQTSKDGKSSDKKHQNYSESKFVNNIGNISGTSNSNYSKSATLIKSN